MMYSKRKTLIILFLLCAVVLSGCATVLNAGHQRVRVTGSDNAEHVAVEVITSDETYYEELPTTILALPTHSGVRIKIVDPCYQKTEIPLPQTISIFFWGNFFFLPGFAVDILNGRCWSYTNSFIVPLTKKETCN
ncbi:MAG: hypothetical protein K9K75_03550 [Deltaproteobacteria bacterium]|nr:hypothetical protein [Deltaproteobacteria bacterium]